MLDFLMVSTRTAKGVVEIYPKFIINNRSKDLMIRGGDFYAVWDADTGFWSTDEQDLIRLVDRELDGYANENKERILSSEDIKRIKVLHMWDSDSGSIDRWHKYCQRQSRDNYHDLDAKIFFANERISKESYATKTVPYILSEGDISAYNDLVSVLYSPEERQKLEWAIGSIINGDSKDIQKFIVLYGEAGTGKSTILNIIQKLFDGYYSTFDAKALGSSNAQFALEAFKSNPLVAIQHDGDLSRIEDNTRLNSLVSHELMTVNEKFKSQYTNRFRTFLFMGTNKPVKITDAKSGLLRRLIDVSPTGKKVPKKEYNQLVSRIDFELGAIAWHCREVYESNPGLYDDYIPVSMMSASNDFYNFVSDSFLIFKSNDRTTLAQAWEMYQTYCNEAKVPYPLSKRVFKEELKNYFWDFKERVTVDNGERLRNVYSGFRTDKFDITKDSVLNEESTRTIQFNKRKSIFDEEAASYPAQYANDKGTPKVKWSEVTTTLSDLDTSELHYVKLPKEHIVIDFDIQDENGEKSFEKNLEAASKWPPTYAELSKSGKGIHLHYIYGGDSTKLERLYAENVEIKIFTGNSSLRRKLTKCNGLKIATINSGLPLKGEKPMINKEKLKSEKSLRDLIERNLRKEIHPGTKPSIDFIYKILEDAYEDKLEYDVTDMKAAIFAFAAGSTHQADYCIKLVTKMKFCYPDKEDISIVTEDAPVAQAKGDGSLVFYDVEVFPNLFLVNYKGEGEGRKVIRLINPTPDQIEKLLEFNLVGFNCRRYDNHILYGRMLGYDNLQLYDLSQRIIGGDKNAFFREAYNISYTDVYDFSSKKQSLKKFEIELGIHHKELGLPWDEPVPEEKWEEVAEYCDNDVIATEAVFNARKADWTARRILADVAGGTVNDTTNSLTTKIIFEGNRHPQDQFNYRKLGDAVKGKPYFRGYTYDKFKKESTYRGEVVGEGGYVYAEPGIYYNVALLDIASMHPTSIIQEQLFGKEYTKRFQDIRDARISIKHGEFDKARKMLGGKLAKYLEDESAAKDLAQALKIAINSVYGLTAASFDNPFKDPRNIDNIVAKRGALFMVDLKHAVQEKGYVVAHIKTDSIKIPDADQGIIDFVMEFGKKYGYTFEHEATYDRMCLVNDAVYIAKYADGEHEFKLSTGEKVQTAWTATGTQFQVPYVFKTLFAKKPIKFEDLCETKAVTTALYLDFGGEDEEEKKRFVGRVGLFCPVKPGTCGGLLYREKDGKYYAATGTKGYYWQESEVVKGLGRESDIDRTYYEKLVEDARNEIGKYGDVEIFCTEGN